MFSTRMRPKRCAAPQEAAPGLRRIIYSSGSTKHDAFSKRIQLRISAGWGAMRRGGPGQFRGGQRDRHSGAGEPPLCPRTCISRAQGPVVASVEGVNGDRNPAVSEDGLAITGFCVSRLAQPARASSDWRSRTGSISTATAPLPPRERQAGCRSRISSPSSESRVSRPPRIECSC